MSYTSKTNPPPMGLPLARPDKVFCSGQSCPRYGPNKEKLGVPRPTDLIRPLLPTSKNETYLISSGALIQRWHGDEFSFWGSIGLKSTPQLLKPRPMLGLLSSSSISPQKRALSCLSPRNRNVSVSGNSATLLLLLLSHFSCVQLCATPWTAAYQAPPSMEFSRQEYYYLK